MRPDTQSIGEITQDEESQWLSTTTTLTLSSPGEAIARISQSLEAQFISRRDELLARLKAEEAADDLATRGPVLTPKQAKKYWKDLLARLEADPDPALDKAEHEEYCSPDCTQHPTRRERCRKRYRKEIAFAAAGLINTEAHAPRRFATEALARQDVAEHRKRQEQRWKDKAQVDRRVREEQLTALIDRAGLHGLHKTLAAFEETYGESLTRFQDLEKAIEVAWKREAATIRGDRGAESVEDRIFRRKNDRALVLKDDMDDEAKLLRIWDTRELLRDAIGRIRTLEMVQRTADLEGPPRYCKTCAVRPVSFDKDFCCLRCKEQAPRRERERDYVESGGHAYCRVCRRWYNGGADVYAVNGVPFIGETITFWGYGEDGDGVPWPWQTPETVARARNGRWEIRVDSPECARWLILDVDDLDELDFGDVSYADGQGNACNGNGNAVSVSSFHPKKVAMSSTERVRLYRERKRLALAEGPKALPA